MRARVLSIMRVRLLQRPASQIVINFSNGLSCKPPETKLSYTVMSNDYSISLVGYVSLVFFHIAPALRSNSYALSFFSPSSPMKRLANAPIYKRRMCNGHFHQAHSFVVASSGDDREGNQGSRNMTSCLRFICRPYYHMRRFSSFISVTLPLVRSDAQRIIGRSWPDLYAPI